MYNKLYRENVDTTQDFIDDNYAKLSESGKTKFRMKVAKRKLSVEKAQHIWALFGWFGFHQLYMKNYNKFLIRLFTMSCFLVLWFADKGQIEKDVKKYNEQVELEAILELI